MFEVVVGVSSRHVHLTQEHLEILFGPGYKLTPLRELNQPGQYAAEETVTLVGTKGSINRVRILGPVRSNSQVEISLTDAFVLGINPPIRDSGDIEDSSPVILEGPEGEIELSEGAIVAKRHIHMHTEDADKLSLKDKDHVTVEVDGERGLIFKNVLVRVKDSYECEFHVDTDEANAAGLKTGDKVKIIPQKALQEAFK
ncbi:phosphate propanoyltransferase [Natranaerofaba carboxydovora]|uniref:phosphate propanoyltransferase n=1 Tax=Natranaerofaba carboxydovora TaxID=2742683 RepID=UPI001F14394D|nr:phosphate propanoyltransferase [Natranaerofaba carboxydovora]UMZ73500.1 Phosphate propanoyltransferase [Natranaerofaba carboxydovora]